MLPPKRCVVLVAAIILVSVPQVCHEVQGVFSLTVAVTSPSNQYEPVSVLGHDPAVRVLDDQFVEVYHPGLGRQFEERTDTIETAVTGEVLRE